MTSLPSRYRSGRSQGWRRGRDIDRQAVYRACGGERMPLTTAERREAVRVLLGEGLSSNAIARRLGLTWRTVQRHGAAIRQEKERLALVVLMEVSGG